MTKINTNQICKIAIFRKLQNERYYFKPFKKRFLFKNQKEGFYGWIDDNFKTEESIYKNNCYIEGETVFFNPHIDVYLSNGKEFTKFFKSNKDLDLFLENPDLKQIRFVNF